MQPDYLIALEFAALAGALLGFLRYNFNPASIFMGDGGSYFIGYTIAALSVLGSIKTQLGTTLLIPLLALGVPIFDTLLAPIRRWMLGRRMFHPDKGHIHHQLVERGISSRQAVLIIYGISFVLCAAGIILVHIRNAMAGVLLVVLIIVLFIVIRKLGYLEYLAVDKFSGWFRDLSYEAGFTHSRRSFLNVQIETERSQSIEEIWENVCEAMDIMQFDKGEICFSWPGENIRGSGIGTAKDDVFQEFSREWIREGIKIKDDASDNGVFRIELPLGIGTACTGRLVMIKDLNTEFPAALYSAAGGISAPLYHSGAEDSFKLLKKVKG